MPPSARASLIVAWTTGLKLYHLGDNGLTIEYMDRVLGDTTSAEMRSYALTYIAFAEDRLGHVAAFRDDVVEAVGGRQRQRQRARPGSGRRPVPTFVGLGAGDVPPAGREAAGTFAG